MDLKTYLARPGAESLAELARRLDIHEAQIRQWRDRHDGRRPSPESAADIERATSGMVTCEELRTDLVWQRKPDRSWPHPKGRPLHDVSAAAV